MNRAVAMMIMWFCGLPTATWAHEPLPRIDRHTFAGPWEGSDKYYNNVIRLDTPRGSQTPILVIAGATPGFESDDVVFLLDTVAVNDGAVRFSGRDTKDRMTIEGSGGGNATDLQGHLTLTFRIRALEGTRLLGTWLLDWEVNLVRNPSGNALAALSMAAARASTIMSKYKKKARGPN